MSWIGAALRRWVVLNELNNYGIWKAMAEYQAQDGSLERIPLHSFVSLSGEQ